MPPAAATRRIDSASPVPAATRGDWLIWMLYGVAAIALAMRVTSVAQPLGIDQSLWASAVRGLSRGQMLYRDVWEQRPPGIYFIYLAGFRMFGWTSAAIAWLDIVAALITTTTLAIVGARLHTPRAGALAAALFATLTMPAWLFGYGGFLERSVCETFISMFAGLAAWAATGIPSRRPTPHAIALGLCFGALVVLKPNAGIYVPALMAWLAWRMRIASDAIARRRWTAAVACAIASASVIGLTSLLWIIRNGALDDARVAVIDFNRFYVGQGFALWPYSVALARAVWLRIKTDPLWLAGCIAGISALLTLVGAHKRDNPDTADSAPRTDTALPMLIVCWAAAALLAIVVNGARLFNSYFMQAFPPLALAAAWWLTTMTEQTTSRTRRIAGGATVVLMIALLVGRDYAGRISQWVIADIGMLRGTEPVSVYLERFGGYANNRGYSARANTELAAYVRAHTTDDDRIFLFGINGAGVYFDADRLTAHRFLRVNFFVPTEFPHPDFTLSRVVEQLQQRPPRYLIFEQLHGRSPMAALADALPESPELAPLLRSYEREIVIEDFTLYRRLSQ